MNELLQAAKSVIGEFGYLKLTRIEKLRAAVEQAEKPPAGFEEWYQRTMDDDNASIKAKDCWQDATRAERERIKQIITYQFGDLVSDLDDVFQMIDDDSEHLPLGSEHLPAGAQGNPENPVNPVQK